MSLFQYQALVEPLEPSLFRDVPFSWVPPTNQPTHRRPPAHLETAVFQPVVAAATLPDMSWSSIIAQMSPRPRASTLGDTFYVAEPSLILTPPGVSWLAVVSDPIKKPRLSKQESFFAPLEPSLILNPPGVSWFQPTSQPVLRPRQTALGQFVIAPVQTASAAAPTFTSWMQPTNQPTRRFYSGGVDQVVAPPAIIAVLDAYPTAVAWKVVHDERAVNSQSRAHEQQVANILNNLVRKGQLLGTTTDPALGYRSTNIQSWVSQTPPTTIEEALDRIAAALALLGQKP